MSFKHMPTQKKWILFTGYVVSPTVFCLFFLFHQPSQNNWTGLLSNPASFPSTLFVTLILGIDVVCSLIHLGHCYHIQHAHTQVLLFVIFCFLTILFPYGTSHTATQLHLLFALLSFFSMHVYLCQTKSNDIQAVKRYGAFLFLTMLLVVNAYHIDGYSEMVFGVGLRWFLTDLQKEKM